MTYYIAIDIGSSWDELYRKLNTEPLRSWGVSKSQSTAADKLQKDDVLLHYIHHAQVWAGYSVVGGPVATNTHDENADWRAALPWAIPIVSGKYLSKLQCQSLHYSLYSMKKRHRQGAFTKVPNVEAELIVAAIDYAAKTDGAPTDQKFDGLWEQDPDAYYGRIRKVDIADCKCEACGADGLSWVKMHLDGLLLRPKDQNAPSEWFLDAAHIVAQRPDGGKVTPDNIRALCPNCHRLTHHLPRDVKERFLKRLPRAAT